MIRNLANRLLDLSGPQYAIVMFGGDAAILAFGMLVLGAPFTAAAFGAIVYNLTMTLIVTQWR